MIGEPAFTPEKTLAGSMSRFTEGGREGGSEEGREEGREGGSEEGREEGREGVSEEGREGGREEESYTGTLSRCRNGGRNEDYVTID